MKIMREIRQYSKDKDQTKVSFSTYKVDLTKAIEIEKKVFNTIISNDDMLKNDILLQSTIAKVMARFKAAIAQSLILKAYNEVKDTKLFATADGKQTTAQPAWKTTTAETLVALKDGQKVTGLLTDLFADGEEGKDYNAFKLVWQAIKELKRIGTEKSKERYYAFAENGFTSGQIMVLASTDMVEKLRAAPSYKTVIYAMNARDNKNEYFNLTGYINNIPILECNQLDNDVEAIVMTKDALLVADLPIADTPLAKIILGDGARREIDGVIRATPLDAKMLMAEGKFAVGVAYPNEMIFIRSA